MFSVEIENKSVIFLAMETPLEDVCSSNKLKRTLQLKMDVERYRNDLEREMNLVNDDDLFRLIQSIIDRLNTTVVELNLMYSQV